MNGDINIPKLKPQPTLLQRLAMEQGRLALYAFGKPTDPVFDIITIPGRPSAGVSPDQELGKGNDKVN
jgi:hypothetical protein